MHHSALLCSPARCHSYPGLLDACPLLLSLIGLASIVLALMWACEDIIYIESTTHGRVTFVVRVCVILRSMYLTDQSLGSPTVELFMLLGVKEDLKMCDFGFPILLDESEDGDGKVVKHSAVGHVARGLFRGLHDLKNVAGGTDLDDNLPRPISYFAGMKLGVEVMNVSQ